MSRDRSLDEFLGDEDDPDADGTGEEGSDGEEAAPAGSTYCWRPDGGPCDRCGATVPDRWRSEDGGLVCGDCKDW